jgi:fructosamine-3-kinase
MPTIDLADPIQFLESVLFESLGYEVSVANYELLSGGDINTTLRIDTEQGFFVVKWNEQAGDDLFEAEAKGLQLLQKAGSIRVPEVINYGRKAEKAYLLLQHIERARPKAEYWAELGRRLAGLHQQTNSLFGLDYDNYIGALRQTNTRTNDGIQFFIESRLKVQVGLAFYNSQLPKCLYDKFFELYERLPELLPAEPPALLHGDLWSGNLLVDEQGEPCLIDPAVHYGLREMEIAFTRLFGGFHENFYNAYREAFPLAPGFEQRVDIYNLYPLLVHVNLFGSGYLPGVERVLEKF